MITIEEGEGFLDAVDLMLNAAVEASGANRDRILDSLFRWLCRPYESGRRRRPSALESLSPRRASLHKLADPEPSSFSSAATVLQRSDSTTLYVSVYVDLSRS
jgi:hypothetical protein